MLPVSLILPTIMSNVISTICTGFIRLPAASTPPASTPVNSERYTSLVISARPMAITGGSSDQAVPNAFAGAAARSTSAAAAYTISAMR